jgi:deoxyhypusine synthase
LRAAARKTMKVVEHLRIKPHMTIKELTSEFAQVGVLGSRRFAHAASILSSMFTKKEFSNILSLAGPMVPGGLRLIIRDLIAEGFIHAIVSTGANVTHDLIEAFGFRHVIGKADMNDNTLKDENIGRIYDILVEGEAFVSLEKNIHNILEETKFSQEKRDNLSTMELLYEIGSKLEDNESILKICSERKIPIFCPAIYDSMLGMDLWTYAQLEGLRLNPFLDFTKLVDITFEATKVGLIILGGGLPKHYALIANILRGGTDLAVQITMDRPEPGGLSGAPLEESISWKKIGEDGEVATVIGDATILFPLLVATALPNDRKN